MRHLVDKLGRRLTLAACFALAAAGVLALAAPEYVNSIQALSRDALVLACVEINHWFGASPPNFRNLSLGQIDVDSADFWTTVPLWSRSRSFDQCRLHIHSDSIKLNVS